MRRRAVQGYVLYNVLYQVLLFWAIVRVLWRTIAQNLRTVTPWIEAGGSVLQEWNVSRS